MADDWDQFKRIREQDSAALRAGDYASVSEPGFAQFLVAHQAAKPLAQKQAERLERDRETYSPTVGMSTGGLLAAGAGKMVADMGVAATQAVPWSSVDRAAVDERNKRDAPLMKTTAGKVGYGVGAVAAGVPMMMAPGAGSTVGASLYSGLLGALTPVGTGDSVLRNSLVGMAGGGGAAFGVNRLAQIAQPVAPQGVNALKSAGITLTPGQRMGGAWHRAEQGATSIPITGDMVRSAQRRSFVDFNEAIANRALEPIGGKLPKGLTGWDAVAYAERALGDVYDVALKRIGAVKSDAAFMAEIKSLEQMVATGPMPEEVKRQFKSVIQNQIKGKLQGQSAMTAETFKQADSEMGRFARLYGKDASADKQQLGDALAEAQAAMRRLLERVAGPDIAGDVKAANQGWAEFKRMQRAAQFLGARDGVFSPENYLNAVKALDKSLDHGKFARGKALGQDFAADAVRIMGREVPDSGTPFRSMMTNPISAAFAGAPTLIPAMAYEPHMQKLIQALMSDKRPALATKLAAELQAAAPALSALGVTGANVYQRTKQ